MKRKALVFVLLIALFSPLAFSGTWMDDFSDGNLDGWSMYENFWINKIVVKNSGNWVIEDGAAIAGDDNPGRVYGLYIGDMSWKDYITEASIKLSKELEKRQMFTGVWFGVRLQLDDGKLGLNDYGIGMWNDDGRNVFKGGTRYVDGIFLDIQMSQIQTEANVWYRFKMTAKGNHITGFIDGEKVFDLVDGTFTSGAVVIAINGVRAAFDDFMVTGPEIPDNQLGRSVKSSGKLVTTWANIKASN